MTTVTGPEATLASILDAAESCFGEAGFRGTSMARVAERAGVSRPLVHRYFGDKETLYRQMVDRLLREWNRALLEVADRQTPTTGHALRALILECTHWARDRGMLRGILLRDADVTRLIAGATLEEGRRRLPALLEQVLIDGVARGDIRADLPVQAMAMTLTEIVVAGALQAITADSENAYRERVDAMIEVVLHGVVIAPTR